MKIKANHDLMTDLIMQDEMYREEADAFITHNRSALNQAMEDAYKDIEMGCVSTFSMDAIIEEGRKLHTERQKLR